jgi:uncharacterized repeat protein (TIGR03803 family)
VKTLMTYQLLAFTITLFAATAQAQTFKLLYSFTGGADGGNPWAAPLLHDGMLYGTTWTAGANNFGVVYRVDIKSGQETVLHAFAGGKTDGASSDAGLIRDEAGNLYGVTDQGGATGAGAVFRLKPDGTIVLASLNARKSGFGPQGTLVRDAEGNLYGTAYFDGPHGDGTVYRVDPAGQVTAVHGFNQTNGAGPKYGPLVLDHGNLYGATFFGGTANLGTIYRVNMATGETVLHSFAGGTDGAFPLGGLARDNAGNLYGTTSAGGAHTSSLCVGQAPGCGTVFKLDSSGNYSTIYSFTGGSDGSGPEGFLTVDAQGNIYGTTDGGGYVGGFICSFGCGTIFKIDTTGAFFTLHAFTGSDGAGMFAGVVPGPDGTLYGTSPWGGANDWGTVFALKP